MPKPDQNRVRVPEDVVPPRILVVDDEHSILDATCDYLKTYGLAVDSAWEREEAEALLIKFDYRLVVLDMRLTGVHGREGLELLRFVREYRPEARVIVLTAHGSEELEAEAKRRGVDAFLEKPLPLSELAQTIYSLLGDNRLLWPAWDPNHA